MEGGTFERQTVIEDKMPTSKIMFKKGEREQSKAERFTDFMFLPSISLCD